MSSVINITRLEAEEYVLLLEKLLALRSLRIIMEENKRIKEEALVTDEKLNECKTEVKKVYRLINNWWEYVDKKYILVHNEDKVLSVDFNRYMIFEIDKYENKDDIVSEV